VYARATTFRARPESLDAGIKHVRDEVMPVLLSMPGCIGLSMLVDRETGRCIAASAWRTEEAMRATEVQIRPLRQRVGEILGGRPDVNEWEIAVLHRDHRSPRGACVRATWVQTDPADLEHLIETYRTMTLPGLAEFEGFCSASLMVDGVTGRAVSSVTFDSTSGLAGSRRAAASLRERTITAAKAQVLDVEEFDLALAHLHVPEMV
jgi:quinol monooxygenase YgiN